MNYFNLFNIPVSLKVDSASLLKQYYVLSKQYHPDNFTLSDDIKKDNAELMTAMINEAKKILDSPYKRLEYILKEKNIIESDEKFALPPAFLAEMMDINEQLMELEFEKDDEKMLMIKKEIAAMETSIFKEVAHLFDQDYLSFTDQEAELLKLYYYKKKYLQRIGERLN
ncbi:MAG TPA: iron-sulfur cluster co-chaperone HscB C-terminal domain-containing protein [Chitinophagaceae bacterium]|nr:iron-sulfur cluster co-chaperone HscB C-terminal domain-containing protein [Chitinophagaceae bacterium]